MDIEKIFIGPIMVLSEMILFGHYTENIKIIKQVSNLSYPIIVSNLWTNYRYKCFFIGLYPWGMLQIVKGLPVTFTQSHIYNYLNNYNETNRMLISGFISGIIQGIFLTPTQRLKTIVMTDPSINCYNYLKKNGLMTLFNGLSPMMARRGCDWCVRYYGVHLIENKIGKKVDNMSLMEKIGTGFFGGCLSGITTPIDVIIAKTQEANCNNNTWNVIKNMDIKMFGRGFLMKIFNAGYHTAFVIGIGDYIYGKLKK